MNLFPFNLLAVGFPYCSHQTPAIIDWWAEAAGQLIWYVNAVSHGKLALNIEIPIGRLCLAMNSGHHNIAVGNAITNS